jgi:integrase
MGDNVHQREKGKHYFFSMRIDTNDYPGEGRARGRTLSGRGRYLRRGGYPTKTAARQARDDIKRLLHKDVAGTNERFRRQLGTLIFERTKRGEPLPTEAEIKKWRGADYDPSAPPLTLGQLMDDWLADQRIAGLRPTTLGRLRNDVRVWWRPQLGAVPVHEVGVTDLRAVRDWLLRRNEVVAEARAAGLPVPDDPLDVRRRPRVLQPSSIRQVFNTIQGVLDYAVLRGVIPENPYVRERVPLPKVPKKPLKTWTPEQVGVFLDHVYELDDRLAVAFQLLFTVGLRVSEVCGLRWGSVDLEAGELRVVEQHNEYGPGDPKTDESRRTVQLDDDTVDALRWHRRRQGEERMLVGLGRAGADDYVFTEPDGSPLRRHVPTLRLQQVARELGLPKLTFHGGRHTALTMMIASGENAKLVSEVAGHRDPRFTLSRYVHPNRSDHRAAAERQAAAIPRRRKLS